MKNKRLLILLTTTVLTNAWASDAGSEGEIHNPYLPRQNSSDIFEIGAHQHVMRLNDGGNVEPPHDPDLARAIAASRRDMTHAADPDLERALAASLQDPTSDPDLARALAASQQPRGREVISDELMRLARTAGIEPEVLLAMSLEEANALLAALRSDTSAAEPRVSAAAEPTTATDEFDAYLAAHAVQHNRSESQHPVISAELRQLARAARIEDEYLESLTDRQANNLLVALQDQSTAEAVRVEFEPEPVQNTRQPEEIRRVRDIVNTLQHINDGGDVHQIDIYTEQNLPAVLQILSDNLSVAISEDPNQVSTTLQNWVPVHFEYRKPNNTIAILAQARLASYIQKALNTAAENRDVIAAYDVAVKAITDMDGDTQTRHRHELLNAIAENYETQGGCFQGVRNRIFIRIVDILCTVLEIRA